MVRVENLKKRFDGVVAVDGITFEIGPGEVVGFLGPNGAGKTTTLRILTGFLAPTEGSARIQGRPVLEDPLAARRRIGYLPESNPLYEDLEVTDYLRYIGRLRRVERLEDRIRRVLGLCGLSDVVGRVAGELSKGFRQRLGLAQAILHDPPILILDEPTSGLDPNQVREVRDLVAALRREGGKTILLSTHILPEVKASCDRAIIIHRGRLAADGTIGELENRAAQTGRMRVTFRVPAENAAGICPALGRIPGIRTAAETESEPGCRSFRLEMAAGADPREEIFRWAARQSIPLLEMAREAGSLEEAFRQLTVEEAG